MTLQSISAALRLWNETSGGVATLINLSENHVYRVDGTDGSRYILRIHRAGYQSDTAIESELTWLTSLRTQTGLIVPRPLTGIDGAVVQRFGIADEDLPRRAVAFHYEEGREPTVGADLAYIFYRLGAIAAEAHEQAVTLILPNGFSRPTWNAASILDADGLWGDWRLAPGVDQDVRDVLLVLEDRLRLDLESYGTSADRFGLIHADMRLANVLVEKNTIKLIDFDDCGFGWFVYDFAAAISFFEDHPDVPALRTNWLAGYRTRRSLQARDIAAINTLVMLRRMALLAWIGSHGETELAKSHAASFARVTVDLARNYLADN